MSEEVKKEAAPAAEPAVPAEGEAKKRSGKSIPAGIAFILFSDTLIALSRFLGRKKVGRWICPTYFACHILITASQIALQKFLG